MLADGGWLTDVQLVTPRGIRPGAVRVARGRIAAIRRQAPRGASAHRLRGAYLAPGFIDAHVWGPPATVSRDAARQGTTTFLTTLGPAPRTALLAQVRAAGHASMGAGAECVGVHLEGPFVNRHRRGALPIRHLRAPSVAELRRAHEAAEGRIRLVTVAPELPGATALIRWSARRGVVVSLGHSEASAELAARAVGAGARGVTHIFNGMPPWHHRRPSLLDVALCDARVTAMVIADGTHVGSDALRLLLRMKGPERIALVTDSIRRAGWPVVRRGGAFYRRDGTLAGSDLSMMRAVRNMVRLAGASLEEAVGMASAVPARLLKLRDRGALVVGRRADLVAFDRAFRVRLTMVGGRVVHKR